MYHQRILHHTYCLQICQQINVIHPNHQKIKERRGYFAEIIETDKKNIRIHKPRYQKYSTIIKNMIAKITQRINK